MWCGEGRLADNYVQVKDKTCLQPLFNEKIPDIWQSQILTDNVLQITVGGMW